LSTATARASEAKEYLRQVAGFRPSNEVSASAVRQARYVAWYTILLESTFLSAEALGAYTSVVERQFGPQMRMPR
jgi:hypothetical protein